MPCSTTRNADVTCFTAVRNARSPYTQMGGLAINLSPYGRISQSVPQIVQACNLQWRDSSATNEHAYHLVAQLDLDAMVQAIHGAAATKCVYDFICVDLSFFVHISFLLLANILYVPCHLYIVCMISSALQCM